ncbi:MAG: prepilin-type N-terminal cleavage/methylation domain-containing protein [Candidatus Colwellbacteria bacterium]|nr:prepilin-type N-terminal cleavage/methylation domain-containing protein [Candidatus Colwellbacteria bacterium]
MTEYNSIRGQSLVEILIAIGISSVLIGGVVTTYVVSLNSNADARLSAVGTELAQETYDNIKAISEAQWSTVYNVTKSTPYHLSLVDQSFDIVSGTEEITIDDFVYTRSFTVENVLRGAGGDIVSSGGVDDPSTQKITVIVEWTSVMGARETKIGGYISRTRNISLRLTNWGDSGDEGPFVSQTTSFLTSDNIDFVSLPGVIKVLNF